MTSQERPASPQMVDELLPGTADAEGWRRLHPLSPLLRGGIALIIIIGVVIANFRDRFVELFFTDRVLGENAGSNNTGDIVALFEFLAEEGLLFVVLGSIAGVLLIIVLIAWFSWRFSTYRITAEAVESRNGVLFRNHRRAPLERIQSVNLQRSLAARVLGLTKIEILTGGQGGKVALAYLGNRDAKTVREQIINRAAIKRGHTAAVHQPDVGAATAHGLSARVTDFIDEDIDPNAASEHTLVRVPVGRLLASIALAWEGIITVLAIVLAAFGAVSSVLGFLARRSDGSTGAGAGIFLTAVPLVLILIGIMISQFNKGFNFTLSRDGDAVRTGGGLTATATETIPFGRIHAVEARQPLLWRPFGWWRVRITIAGYSAAQAGQNGSQNVVLPVGPEADVLRVFDTLLPGVGSGTDAVEVGEAFDTTKNDALRDGLIGSGDGYLGAGQKAGWVLLWGRRRAGIRIADRSTTESTLRVRRGVLTRSLSIMPTVRAQSIQLRRPLVHRMLGLASVQAHTLLGPVRMEMRGIDLEAARAAFDDLAAEVLTVQGADARSREGSAS